MILSYRTKIDRIKSRRDLAERSVERESKTLDEAKQKTITVDRARLIVQHVAEALQRRAHGRIASVATRCLHAVFDDPYDVEIRFERKRNKTEAVIVFVRDGKEFDDPCNEVGGGAIDVAALAFRLSAVVLSKPPLRRLLVLDEPFKCVRGIENRRRVRRMIEALADELGVQFVLNVDSDAYPEFCLGTVVEMGE